MGDMDNEIRISITLDDGTVREGFARVKKSGEAAAGDLKTAFQAVAAELALLLIAFKVVKMGIDLVSDTVRDAVVAAAEYDTALNNMNKALNSAGTYTAQASAEFQALAQHMAATTTSSVKQTLQLEAMARNYTRTNEQAKALTVASIDLAAATGKEVTTALQQLGGTLDGSAGRLGKLVPEIKSMTDMQLRMGDAIGIVAKRFKDSASGDAGTYEGTIKRLHNAFEEFLESMGSIITQSPEFRAILQFITEQFSELAAWVKKLAPTIQAWFRELILLSLDLAKGLSYLLYPIEAIYNGFKVVSTAVAALFLAILDGVVQIGNAIIQNLAPNSKIAQAFKEFAATSNIVAQTVAANFEKAGKDIGKFNISAGIQEKLDELKSSVENAKPFAALQQHVNETKENLYGLSGPLESVGQGFRLMAAGAKNEMLKLRNDAVKYMQEIGSAVTKTFAGGVANAMAAVGRAMVKGQDIFQAFAGAMLSAIGQACLQMGAAYILMGIARVATSYGADPTGWTLIGVGSGMSVLGGALMALGEGMSGSGSSPDTSAASGGGGASGGAPVSGNPAEQVAQEKKSSVTVNIHGSVFDTRETGLRIVELVNDAFTTQGAAVIVK